MFPSPRPKPRFNFDSSVIFLILSNLITIIIAITQKWDFGVILWIYWFQSITIEFFHFLRILNLKNFTTQNVRVNNIPLKATNSAKIFVAFFFLFHYGIFHFAYMIFLFFKGGSLVANLGYITGITAMFFANHLYSFLKNFKQDTEKKQNIGKVMFFPYARIIPMHFTILFGFLFFASQIGLIFFLLLKTIADVIMHNKEHSLT
ncbi:hypothetical protein HQ544_04545 [Candidatus Falkowbacteria bacterium]|nr:hypothetical protein [Candidatus Falkowbacteria bacterium]